MTYIETMIVKIRKCRKNGKILESIAVAKKFFQYRDKSLYKMVFITSKFVINSRKGIIRANLGDGSF